MIKVLVMLANVGLAAFSTPTIAQTNEPVRALLQIPDGCYPVGVNPQTEQIATVCRGQANWSPDALQRFNNEFTGVGYYNPRIQASAHLGRDMRDGVGPVPWFQHYWIPALDNMRVWRPR